MPRSAPTLEQIKQDLLSEKAEDRSRALQNLLLRAENDSSVHALALPIFRASLAAEQDPWGAGSSARGIELIEGPAEGRRAWLALLNHPNEKIVQRAALMVTDRSYLPVLLELLARRPEPGIHNCAIRTLGRMQDPAALPAIVGHLAIPSSLPDAIQALEELGDARAIPQLEPLLKDDTQLWQQDDRGGMLRVCDLAGKAIRRLQYIADQSSAIAVRPDQSPPLLASANPIPATVTPIKSKRNLFAYVPLGAALLEVPWFAMLLFAVYATTGALGKDAAETRRIDLVAMIPAVVGLLTGLWVFFRRKPHRRVERICLYLGCALCAFFIFCFTWEFLH